MKTNYLRNRFSPNLSLKVLAGAFVALVLLLVFYGDALERKSGTAFDFLRPILGISSSMKSFWRDTGFAVSDKINLGKENENLREEIANLKGDIEGLEILRQENESLRGVLRRPEDKKMFARIMLAPPETIYDTFILDVGSRDGVEVGMSVISAGGVFLGHITEVSDDTSKVELISDFGKETNVYLESSGLPVILSGQGAETMHISMPREAEVLVGERVLTLSRTPYLVGFVEKIENKSSDLFQTLVVRVPLNIWSLRSVVIVR